MLRSIGLAAGCMLVGSASLAAPSEMDGQWSGIFQCTQHHYRSDVAGSPINWTIPFQVAAGRITGSRDYFVPVAGPLHVEFRGIIHPDSNVEIAAVALEPAARKENWSETMQGHVVGNTASLSGNMMVRGRNVRYCQLEMKNTGGT